MGAERLSRSLPRNLSIVVALRPSHVDPKRFLLGVYALAQDRATLVPNLRVVVCV